MYCEALICEAPDTSLSGDSLKGKNLLPLGANSFLKDYPNLEKGGKSVKPLKTLLEGSLKGKNKFFPLRLSSL